MNHLISSKQFNNVEQLEDFFKIVDYIAYNYHTLRHRKVMASLFYEPSTRTRFSFEAAMHKLRGSVISESDPQKLSVAKGESLEDTIQTVSQYVDLIVLRHPGNDAAERAVKVSNVPIINAGSGINSHPTQSLLDMYTIREKFKFDGLKILLCGDLYNGRTVRSLIQLLDLYENIKIILCSPHQLNILDNIPKKNLSFCHYKCLAEALEEKPNVVYLTRLQKERIKESFDINWDDFCLTPDLMKEVDWNAMILHPLPRLMELPAIIDTDPRAVYFTKQIKNGLIIRMALLHCILGDKVCWDKYSSLLVKNG